MRESTYQALRRFFGWQYSNVFIFTIFSFGIAMWTLQKYVPAFVFISLSGMWAMTYWQFSDFLAGKRRTWLAAEVKFRRKPKSKPKMARARDAKKSFLVWNLTVSVLILTALILCLNWVRVSELNDQREDAHGNIEISYSIPAEFKNDATHSQITVTNNSGQNLTAMHMVACYANLVVTQSNSFITGLWSAQNANQGWLLTPHEPSPSDIQESWPISGKGTSGNKDAITESCLKVWSDKVRCADMTIRFDYFLATQPDNLQHIDERIVSNVDGWYQQSLEKPGSVCWDAMAQH